MKIALRLGMAVLLVAGVLLAQPAASARPTGVSSLPEPFASWSVVVQQVDDDPNVLQLSFDSPTLRRRVTNTVFLPTSYSEAGVPMPVMYYLHGTVVSPLDNRLLDPVTTHEALLKMISGGGGARQTDLLAFDATLAQAKFVVVAPDTDPDDSWCETCAWIDGRDDVLPNVPPVTAETVAADTHLQDELIPLVEALFNVRTDRGGRGVMGFSMGGWSALLQAMKHPDRFSYVASVSGVYDILNETEFRAIDEAVGYLRDQGYGTGLTQPVWWKNFNPPDVSSNLSGIDTQVFLSAGDECLLTAASEDCRRYPALLNPLALVVENLIVRHFGIAQRDLHAKGIAPETARSPGLHGSNNHRIYSDHIVPSANAAFARTVAPPAQFSYRAVESEFAVWGYDVSVDRARAAFLDLDDARTDGRGFRIRGTGVAHVTTPSRFVPGSTHRVVTATPDGTIVEDDEVVASADGRLSTSVDLSGTELTVTIS